MAHKEVCDSIPKEKCQEIPRQMCKDVPKEKCDNVPKQECKTVAKEKCTEVPKTTCESKPREKCINLPNKTCESVPKETCAELPVQKCSKIPRKVCAKSTATIEPTTTIAISPAVGISAAAPSYTGGIASFTGAFGSAAIGSYGIGLGYAYDNRIGAGYAADVGSYRNLW